MRVASAATTNNSTDVATACGTSAVSQI